MMCSRARTRPAQFGDKNSGFRYQLQILGLKLFFWR